MKILTLKKVNNIEMLIC